MRKTFFEKCTDVAFFMLYVSGSALVVLMIAVIVKRELM